MTATYGSGFLRGKLMPEVIPAIIPKDFQELQQKIKLVEPYVYPEPGRGVQWVQLDISDGKFTTMKSWSSPEDLKQIDTKLNLEAHLMISEPEKRIERWINSGVKRILIHYESTEHLAEIIKKIKDAGLEAGVVLNLQTPISILDELQIVPSDLQVIQLMGISEIGYYSHPFSDRVIPKIFSLKVKFDNVKIAVDGGINAETAKKVAQAGADILVAGSAIFGAQDIGKAIEELKGSLS